MNNGSINQDAYAQFLTKPAASVSNGKAIRTYPYQRERHVLLYFRSGEWRALQDLNIVIGQRLLATLIAHGWMECRTDGNKRELRITEVGREAVCRPIPTAR
jgi:hypothetical protein